MCSITDQINQRASDNYNRIQNMKIKDAINQALQERKEKQSNQDRIDEINLQINELKKEKDDINASSCWIPEWQVNLLAYVDEEADKMERGGK